MIGITEIGIVAALGIFFFGGKKVVDWAKTVGKIKKEINNPTE